VRAIFVVAPLLHLAGRPAPPRTASAMVRHRCDLGGAEEEPDGAKAFP
jgi:hypothetical protein